MSVAEREQGWVLMCCARARSDVSIECRDVRNGRDVQARKLPARILSLERVATDVMVLRLQLPLGGAFHFQAGQYVDFLLSAGQRRSFSIANPPQQTETIELHIRHVPGGSFTEQVFHRFKVRDILRLEGPLGTFFLQEPVSSTVPIVFLAGGTGFAPVKSIIEDMIARDLHCPVTLYWGARSTEGLYMHGLAERWARELAWFRYVPVISDNPPEDWRGRRGLVHRAVMEDLPDLSQHQVYACGAPAMIEAARKDLIILCGMREETFFADAFTFSNHGQL